MVAISRKHQQTEPPHSMEAEPPPALGFAGKRHRRADVVLEAELTGAASNSPSRAVPRKLLFFFFFGQSSMPSGAFASIAMATGGGSKGNLHPWLMSIDWQIIH